MHIENSTERDKYVQKQIDEIKKIKQKALNAGLTERDIEQLATQKRLK